MRKHRAGAYWRKYKKQFRLLIQSLVDWNNPASVRKYKRWL